MSEYYEIEYRKCPKCGHEVEHYRPCLEMYCEDGYIDDHEDDPINFRRGESHTVCRACSGTGIERWCPKCGRDHQKETA